MSYIIIIIIMLAIMKFVKNKLFGLPTLHTRKNTMLKCCDLFFYPSSLISRCQAAYKWRIRSMIQVNHYEKKKKPPDQDLNYTIELAFMILVCLHMG